MQNHTCGAGTICVRLQSLHNGIAGLLSNILLIAVQNISSCCICLQSVVFSLELAIAIAGDLQQPGANFR